MSYVYKYELKKVMNVNNYSHVLKCEDSIDVLNEIVELSPIFFGLVLKNCYTCENKKGEKICIKFDLYSPLNRSVATSFGIFLKRYVSNYGDVYRLKKVNNVFYAVVYSKSEEEFKVEFIDEMFIDNISEFKTKSREYFLFDEKKADLICKRLENDLSNERPKIDASRYREELKKAKGIFKERGESLPYNMKESLFISLLKNINDNFDKGIFENGDKVDFEDSYMKLYSGEGQIRSIKNFNLDEDNRIYLKNDHDESMLKLFNVTDKNYEDYGYKEYIDISNWNEEKLEKLEEYKNNKEDVYVNYALCNEIEIPKNLKPLRFNVYNVGQALCTSLSVDKSIPFLYFDFGNKLSEKTKLEYNKETIVVISHNHDDHWNELINCLRNEIYPKSIYIMDDCQEIAMNQILGMLCLHGVKTYRIVANINASNIIHFIPVSVTKMKYNKLINNKKISINHNMNSGIMFIEHNGKRILVPGDQLYDNIDSKYKDDLNILVATHHGQTHGGPIPINTMNGRIIYSFKENRYGNEKTPSKYDDYKDEWKIEAFTPDGNFGEIIIF